MRYISLIKNVIVLMWNRHHFIIPPKYWKKYFKSFIGKISMKREYYNPFDIKDYNMWIKRNSDYYDYTITEGPLISFIIPVYNIEREYLSDCLESILNQSYQNFEICLADDHSTNSDTIKTLKEYEMKDSRIKVVYRKENGHISKATNSALEIASGDYIALMDDDDILSSDALYKVALAINENDADFIYSDEDKLDMSGNLCEPHFKSDFAEHSLYGGNYICHFTIVKKELFDKIGGFREEYVGAQDFDLFLRATEKAKKICHIPEILYHWRKVPGSTADTIGNKTYAIENGKMAVEASLKRKGKNAYVTVPIKSTHYVVHYNVKGSPLVSIIMIDCNKNSIKNNLNEFYKNNSYKKFEVIVDFDSLKTNYNNVIFKKDSINNLIKMAKGEFILIVSGKVKLNDLNIIEEMIGYASQDEIGVVGPKIYNYGKLIKSAGLILSNKNIYIDAFNSYFTDSYGLYGRLLVPYNYSALSDVFLMFSKIKFDEVNGFRDDVNFTLSSIDFCLKLLKKNYQNVLLSHLFINQKDISRINRYEISEVEKNIIRKSWNLDNNVYYNKNLSKDYGFMLPYIGDNNEK
ncbi:MAG: glycosyltransferase [Bacilli bacterium]|nr:glycosyltransferase [Bacilli bacterium]